MNPDTLTVADFPIGTRVIVRDNAYPSATRGKVGEVIEVIQPDALNDGIPVTWPLRVRLDGEDTTEVYSPRELEIIGTSLGAVDVLRRKAQDLRDEAGALEAQADALDVAIDVLEQ